MRLFIASCIFLQVHLIVGIDAGIHAAYAALDLNGQLVGAGCEKEASHEKLVASIRPVGIPSIVACDVRKPPAFVSKIAARFNALLFVPSHDLTSEEKRAIGAEIPDVHVRDAYAAAVKAYRAYANRLRQIDALPSSENKDRLKHLVLQGHALTKLLQGQKQTAYKRKTLKTARNKK